MLLSETDQSPSSAEKERENRGSRFEVVLAASILGFLAAIVAAFLALSPDREEAKVANSAPRSAASWIRDSASDAGKIETQLSAADSVNRPEEKRYEPVMESVTEKDDTSDDEDEQDRDSAHGLAVKKGTVKSGVPVITSLTKLGLSSTEAHEIISALDGVFDFRRARPGHTFELHFDPANGKAQYFRYEESIVDVYEVSLRNEKFQGRKKIIPTNMRLLKTGGVVATSLYAAVTDLHLHSSLAGKIADVLSNQVNFFKEQRPGDAFKVVVEEETVGETFIKYGPILALEYQGVKVGRKRFFYFDGEKTEPRYYDDKGISVPVSVIRIPLHYTKVSSRFGMRYHPILKRKLTHGGVDFSAPSGTPVWACAPGEVTAAEWRGANGNLVVIRHEDDLLSYYAHLQRFAAGIKIGKRVGDRQVIGYVGSTGRSTGPHLHFGLKRGGKFIDPLKYKIRPGRPIAPRYRDSLRKVIKDRNAALDLIKVELPSEPILDLPDVETEVLGEEELE